MQTGCSSSPLPTQRRQSSVPASGRRCCSSAASSPATPPCAVSGCCCSVPPSAPSTPFVWTCSTSIFRHWTSPRTLPRRTPAPWRCSVPPPWQRPWKTPAGTRISAPLQTCTARGAPTNRQKRPCCTCMIFSVPCRTTTGSWRSSWSRGRGKTALLPPAGITCFWNRRHSAPVRHGSCWEQQ